MRQPAPGPYDERSLPDAMAVAWSLRLSSVAPSEADMADFADWLLETPEHADAWDRMTRLLADLEEMRRRLSRHADQQPGDPAAQGQSDH